MLTKNGGGDHKGRLSRVHYICTMHWVQCTLETQCTAHHVIIISKLFTEMHKYSLWVFNINYKDVTLNQPPNETWTDISVIFCLKFLLKVNYVESMMQGLMYLQVSIVSADALEPAGLKHLSANTDLTNVSICCFDCDSKRVNSFRSFWHLSVQPVTKISCLWKKSHNYSFK